MGAFSLFCRFSLDGVSGSSFGPGFSIYFIWFAIHASFVLAFWFEVAK